MIWQKGEMIRDDWRRIYNVATRNRACTKNTYLHPSRQPLSGGIHLPSISNNYDAFSTDLAAGVFDPKLTVGRYAVGACYPQG